MITWLANYLGEEFFLYHLFNSLMFKGVLSVIISIFIALVFGPWFIRMLGRLQMNQAIRNDGPESHLEKQGTPTMGGALILFAVLISTLICADLTNHYIWSVLAILLVFGAVGWVDDYRKVVQKNPKGLPGRWKLFWQSLMSIALLY
jgi:phospho-N-acetylmuramoyl-pentapeptide-transferase